MEFDLPDAMPACQTDQSRFCLESFIGTAFTAEQTKGHILYPKNQNRIHASQAKVC